MEKVENRENMEHSEGMESKISYRNSAIDGRIIRAVEEMGFETMTPIQEQAIPVMLEGRDLIGHTRQERERLQLLGFRLSRRLIRKKEDYRRSYFAQRESWLYRRRKKSDGLQNICMK